MVWLQEFVRESNRIEGINRILEHEVEGHRMFLRSDATTEDIQAFIEVCVPGHRLRENLDMNVTVGSHTLHLDMNESANQEENHPNSLFSFVIRLIESSLSKNVTVLYTLA